MKVSKQLKFLHYHPHVSTIIMHCLKLFVIYKTMPTCTLSLCTFTTTTLDDFARNAGDFCSIPTCKMKNWKSIKNNVYKYVCMYCIDRQMDRDRPQYICMYTLSIYVYICVYAYIDMCVQTICYSIFPEVQKALYYFKYHIKTIIFDNNSGDSIRNTSRIIDICQQ